MNEYERLAIRMSLDRERLGHENHGFCQERVSVLDKDRELQFVYRCLGEVERELSHTCAQLQQAREEIDTRTHAIVHLEHAVE
jgi:hypothetical protein